MRPRVLCNFAVSFDGKISTRTGSPSGFAGPHDKARFREIRALGDGLLAGARTVAADRMSMGLGDAALRQLRLDRGQSAEPLRVIVSNSGAIDLRWKVFRNARTPLVIFTTRRAPKNLCTRLPDFCDLWLAGEECVDLNAVLTILRREYRVRTLVCEGGGRLFRSLAEIGAVDELFLTIARKVFGGRQAPTLTGLPGHFFGPVEFSIRERHEADGEVFLRLVAKRPKTGA